MASRLNPSWRHWQPSDVDRLRSLALAGKTASQVADELGRAHCAVRCKAMRKGIRFPRKGGRPGPKHGYRRFDPELSVILRSARLRDAIRKVHP